MTALVQSASTGGRPILLHYSVQGGHSAGVSVDQEVQDAADQLTFLWTETGQASARRGSSIGSGAPTVWGRRLPGLKLETWGTQHQ